MVGKRAGRSEVGRTFMRPSLDRKQGACQLPLIPFVVFVGQILVWLLSVIEECKHID